MKHKLRKTVAMLFCLGFGLNGVQAQYMYVKQSDGSQTAFSLSTIRKMTFEAGHLIVQRSDNTTSSHVLNVLRNLSFGDYVITDAKFAESDQLYSYPNPVIDVLHIKLGNTPQYGHISILTLDGKVQQAHDVIGETTVILDLSQLSQGVYLCRYIHQNEFKTIKVIKQ